MFFNNGARIRVVTPRFNGKYLCYSCEDIDNHRIAISVTRL